MFKMMGAVALGAAVGAILRWVLGMQLNHALHSVQLGTLSANLIGGYVIGVAMAYFAQMPNLAPEWRLLIVTGFCGGLTTFSTFSMEAVTLLQQGRYGWAIGMIATHVLGSLCMTLLGLASVVWWKSAL